MPCGGAESNLSAPWAQTAVESIPMGSVRNRSTAGKSVVRRAVAIAALSRRRPAAMTLDEATRPRTAAQIAAMLQDAGAAIDPDVVADQVRRACDGRARKISLAAYAAWLAAGLPEEA